MLAEGATPLSVGPLSGFLGLCLLPWGDREGGKPNPQETLLLPILGWAGSTPPCPQGALRPKAGAASLAHHSILHAS